MAKDHPYLCDITKNFACTKEGCIANGGPCMMTKAKEYAWSLHGSYTPDELMDWAVAMFDRPILVSGNEFELSSLPPGYNPAYFKPRGYAHYV